MAMTNLPAGIRDREAYYNIGRRLVAFFLDYLLLVPFGLVVAYRTSSSISTARTYVIFGMSILFSLIYECYFISMHGWKGQTAGKMATHVKVYDVSGDRLSFRQAFLRQIVSVVIGVVYFTIRLISLLQDSSQPYDTIIRGLGIAGNVWLFLDAAAMFVTPQRRALHDYIARSVVLREPHLTGERSPGQGLHS